MRRAILLATALATALALAVPVGAVEVGGPSAPDSEPSHDYVMVTLSSPPVASYEGGINGLARTKPERGERLDRGNPAVQAYTAHLNREHANFRAHLASKAPKAEIVREYHLVSNGFAIKLNGARAQTLSNGPGVRVVAPSALYRPAMTVSNELIQADDLWPSAGGHEDAGEGIKIGIIDTGIRADHEAFACKTVAHHGPYASGGDPSPLNTIVFNHGTHVAGTAAGCVLELSGSEEDPTTGTWSGVAPGAELHDYNVFPGFGGGFIAFGGSAFSHDICAAIEDSVADGMDVINMSIGGTVQGPHDFLAECTDAAVDAGIVAAVAAGNSGPGDSTVESPGTAPGALTAGASTNPHFVGISVAGTTSENAAFSFGAALGDFRVFGDTDSGEEGGDRLGEAPVTANYTVTTPANGCTSIAEDLTDQIALIDRGVCSFTTKIRNAQSAGAVGVLVVNNSAGDPVAMGHDGTDPFPTIPAAMLGKDEGTSIKDSGSVTIDGTSLEYFQNTGNEDIIAGFSSRGPTPFTYLIKPDVTAPGVNVYSSVFNEQDPSELGFAYFQGTSMATPHLAGSAALLLDLHPGWSPADVKSALVNTADRVVTDHINGTDDPGVLARGGGRINLVSANSTPVTLDPASVSFGFWGGNKPVSATVDVSVRNVSEGSLACTVEVASDAGASVSASTGSISLGVDESETVTFTLDGGRSNQTASGDYDADITVDCGTDGSVLAPWWVRIDRGAKP